MPIEQYDLRVLICHYWKKGLTVWDEVVLRTDLDACKSLAEDR
jgi:hypothetical protein